jgi:hypothetical protein
MLYLDVHLFCKWDMSNSVRYNAELCIIDVAEGNACFCSYLE